MEICQQEQSWFAIQVRPRHEFASARILRNKGFEEFVPAYSAKRQWSDRQKQIEVPLFAGYVFCKFHPVKKLPIINTAGVIRVVGTHQGPAAIADQEINAIRKIVESGEQIRPHPYIAVGSRIRIEEGPMAGVEGIFMGEKKGSEMIISIDLLQRSISLQIKGYAITSVN
ncbi:MAG: UpxY family transcription antiterminator [Acidobacteriia bacterium]|nr:UpxY family transcription antiterminator [Terriglobia bacterium]